MGKLKVLGYKPTDPNKVYKHGAKKAANKANIPKEERTEWIAKWIAEARERVKIQKKRGY